MYLYNFLYNKNLITKQDKAIIEYGIKVITFNSINIMSIIINSFILFKNLSFSIVFLIMFIPIRIVSGGYHCKTALRCFISFNSIYILMYIVVNTIKYNFITLFILSSILLLLPIYFSDKKSHLKNKKDNKLKNIFVCFFLLLNLLQKNKVLLTATICAHSINIILLFLAHTKFLKKCR